MTPRNMPDSDRIRTCCVPNVNHSLSATQNAYPVSDDINLHWHSKCCCPLNTKLKATDKTPKCMHFSNHLSFLKNWGYLPCGDAALLMGQLINPCVCKKKKKGIYFILIALQAGSLVSSQKLFPSRTKTSRAT